ncbi:hypothetical protein L3Q82_016492 [Scortum barcoo]|uniref:Uncharacterized protein n=1 Tax=Scortum barcoo TaxID=214431 RepID=A0ACB8X796_9TELE|nr:hypothetical protein L3Q82_016492 [Scortum barcoo]
MASQHPSSSSQQLLWVEYAHNTLTCSATGLSPFQCAYGFQPPLAVSLPVIVSIGRTSNKAVIHCESKGWYPEPEVLWLDGEGNLLSAGPPETVRGPDDLYTVSSRVTVEKRHSNRFTCRVQQKNINQTRETQISISVAFTWWKCKQKKSHCMMPCQMDRLSFKTQVSVFSTLIFHYAVAFLLLTYSDGGLSQQIRKPQPIVAMAGDDTTLPCHANPSPDAINEMLEWSRLDLHPRFVHLRRSGKDLADQNPSYVGRTSVSIDGLKDGDMSLKLSKVKLSDEGTYRCFIPRLNIESSVQLVVGVVFEMTKVSTGLLECKSKGWSSEPEVSWLDGEGNLLSAGPPDTVRGPDDLYTVSSRVTVEKRNSNNFTCRVQQKNINHIKEAHIHVPDDFFADSSSSSSPTSTIIGLVVGIIFILAVAFLAWRWRQNKIKNKEHHVDEETQCKGVKQSQTSEQKHLIEADNEESMKNKSKVEEENNSESLSKETNLSGHTEEETQQQKLSTERETNNIPTQRTGEIQAQSVNTGTGSQCVKEGDGDGDEQQQSVKAKGEASNDTDKRDEEEIRTVANNEPADQAETEGESPRNYLLAEKIDTHKEKPESDVDKKDDEGETEPESAGLTDGGEQQQSVKAKGEASNDTDKRDEEEIRTAANNEPADQTKTEGETPINDLPAEKIDTHKEKPESDVDKKDDEGETESKSAGWGLTDGGEQQQSVKAKGEASNDTDKRDEEEIRTAANNEPADQAETERETPINDLPAGGSTEKQLDRTEGQTEKEGQQETDGDRTKEEEKSLGNKGVPVPVRLQSLAAIGSGDSDPALKTGQPQMIGSSRPIVVTLGDDVILPCHLEPAEDASGLTLEWTRPDLNPRFVHVRRSGQELVSKKHKSFEGRTSLFISELKFGNISLKLSKVKLTDQGTYRCFIPTLERESFLELFVASEAVSSAVITLAGIDKVTRGVVLLCESKGWHPEPEALWLDGEGNLLSAGPPETVRGPDDLYTVSSRVTVEKRHSNRFTCRVQEKNINQTREAHIHVADYFFEVQSSSSSSVTGLAVGLAVCILIILLLVFFVWRQNQNKTRRHQEDKPESRQMKKHYKTEEDRQKEQLMLQEKQQRREEAENLTKELETNKEKVELKRAELQQLHEEKQKIENDLQILKKELENKNKEVHVFILILKKKKQVDCSWKESDQLQLSLPPLWQKFEEEHQRRKEAENKVQTLMEELQRKEEELQRKIWELKGNRDDTKMLLLQETQKKQKAQREVDNLKKSGDNQHDDSSSAKRPVIEVDQGGKYIRLRNTSCRDQQLGDWMLKLKINNEEPVSLAFNPGFILKAGKFVTMWVSGSNCPPTDQDFKMRLQRNELSLQSPLRTLSFLVLHLLLTQSCTGQPQLMGPSQPIVAAVGDDVVLPCYLEPAVDVAAMTLEWTRSDLDPVFVHVWRAGQDLVHSKHPSYKDRTSLSVDELKRGNISLKLSDVKPSDQGTYQCYIPKLDKGSSVELVVGAVALVMIDLAGMDRNKGGVMLNCESEGWYPEPEVLWLDGEGNLLSAGPPETVRGPDDLYTVSSRVTVEKRHSNRFTCRVQQKNINQTREAHIHVPG